MGLVVAQERPEPVAGKARETSARRRTSAIISSMTSPRYASIATFRAGTGSEEGGATMLISFAGRVLQVTRLFAAFPKPPFRDLE